MFTFFTATACVPVLLAAAACAPHAANDEGPAALDLRVEPDVARAGGEVTLSLTNRSDRQTGYNLCPAVLDRRVAGEWQQHPESPAEICTMELRILDPGATGDFRHTLPAGLPAGEYRFRVGVEWPLGEENVSVTSHAFRVEA